VARGQNISGNRLGAFKRALETSKLLDCDIASKHLILWQFQKSGTEFTGFQKKCKGKF
jgi:hypothetical protein